VSSAAPAVEATVAAPPIITVETPDSRSAAPLTSSVMTSRRSIPALDHRPDDLKRSNHRSATSIDEITTGSTGFSVAGSISTTPILSTTSWPEVTLPSSA
jgi:hypothetical protein